MRIKMKEDKGGVQTRKELLMGKTGGTVIWVDEDTMSQEEFEEGDAYESKDD